MKTIDKRTYTAVTRLLHELGLPAHLLGHEFLRYAILKVYQEPNVLRNITMLLYPEIAKAYHTSVYSVEKGIRTAIEIAWIRADDEMIRYIFGNTIDHQRAKPSNKEFIAMIVDELHTRGIS